MNNALSMEQKRLLESDITLQNVVQNELGQLKKTAKVYRQQQNSDIFFLSSVEQEMAESKRTLEKLTKEYQAMELNGSQSHQDTPDSPLTTG